MNIQRLKNKDIAILVDNVEEAKLVSNVFGFYYRDHFDISINSADYPLYLVRQCNEGFDYWDYGFTNEFVRDFCFEIKKEDILTFTKTKLWKILND